MSQEPSLLICPHICASDIASSTDEFVLIDVRSPIEFEAEHIEGSTNIPLDILDSRFDKVPRKGQIILVCRSGKRAERAAYILMSKGFQPNVLKGGIVAWQKANLPLQEGRKMLSIERQIQLVVGIGVLTGVLLGLFVNPWFFLIPGFFGAGLTFAGLSGTCALGILLDKAPWNKLKSPSVQRQCGK